MVLDGLSIMLRTAILLGIFSLITENIGAQVFEGFDRITLSQHQGKIQVLCQIKPGFTCHGINIFRRLEGHSEFALIGSVAGICGDLFTSTQYIFEDLDPHPNTLHTYAVQTGSYDLYPFESIFYTNLKSLAFLATPNPCVDFVTIILDHYPVPNFQCYMTDLGGKTMSRFMLQQQVNRLPLDRIFPGVFFVVLYDGKGGFIGVQKLVKID